MIDKLILKNSDIYILDSSFFFSTFQLPQTFNGTFFTSPDIINEIQDPINKIRLESLTSANLLYIESGNEKNRLTMIEKLKNYDNLARLTTPDQSLIVLALTLMDHFPESKIIIVTDDYEVQNIAKILKIKFQSIRYKPIKNIRKYRLKCKACGYVNQEKVEDCENCGNATFYYKKQ